eukprot:scaffold877_cov57-Attheya_sp.AAC.4
MANPMGLYKAWFKTWQDDKEATIVGYYATSPNNLPTAPGGNSKWCYDTHGMVVSLLPRSTGSMSTRSTSSVEEQMTSSTKKRRREVFLVCLGNKLTRTTKMPTMMKRPGM